jgi:hypothetical protein
MALITEPAKALLWAIRRENDGCEENREVATKGSFETLFVQTFLSFALISSYFHRGLLVKGSDKKLICQLFSDF